MIVAGDTVVLRMTFRGTDTGGYVGRAPTGRTVGQWAVTIMHFEGDKVAGNGSEPTSSVCSFSWGSSPTRGPARRPNVEGYVTTGNFAGVAGSWPWIDHPERCGRERDGQGWPLRSVDSHSGLGAMCLPGAATFLIPTAEPPGVSTDGSTQCR